MKVRCGACIIADKKNHYCSWCSSERWVDLEPDLVVTRHPEVAKYITKILGVSSETSYTPRISNRDYDWLKGKIVIGQLPEKAARVVRAFILLPIDISKKMRAQLKQNKKAIQHDKLFSDLTCEDLWNTAKPPIVLWGEWSNLQPTGFVKKALIEAVSYM